MNMEFKRKLPTLHEIKDMYPISEESAQTKKSTDEELEKIFSGKSDRFLLVIGPCSADREDAVLEYISRLREVQEKVKDKIMIVPRIYTNKPRTTGDGYKGMLHQPDPNGLPNMLKGLIAIRKLHIKALEQTGFACADGAVRIYEAFPMNASGDADPAWESASGYLLTLPEGIEGEVSRTYIG